MLASSTRSAPLLLAGLFAFVFALGPTTAQAQIAPDRPGLGDGASVVEAGTFQVELGYQFSRAQLEETASIGGRPIEAESSINLHQLGQLLLRFGAADVLELRAGIGSYGWQSTSTEISSPISSPEFPISSQEIEGNEEGYLGTTLGAKVRLLQTSTVTLSGLTNTTIPTATGDFDTPEDRARQEVKLALNGALGSGLSLTVNGGASFFWAAGEQDDRAAEWLFIPTLNITVNEKVSTYVGYGGFYADDSQEVDAANTNFVEAGLTYLPTPDLQLDVNGGYRVDRNVDSEFFFGFGIAQRF